MSKNVGYVYSWVQKNGYVYSDWQKKNILYLSRGGDDAQNVDVYFDPFLDVECRLTIVQSIRVLNIPVTHVVIRHH